MKPIVIDDLLNIYEYEKVRDSYRKDLLVYKADRRVSLGPYITLTFENRRTMKFQIQEMMRAERMAHDAQIQEEIDIYNSLLPLKDSLSATLFIEVSDEAKIKPVLNQFIGLTLGKSVYFKIGEDRVYATFEAGREADDKISSVHYIQFPFGADSKALFLNSTDPIILGIDYKDYIFELQLASAIIKSLHHDFNS
ncbi:MAG: DUF3501 family protein [Candidatus Marinimicrobia bacterium]|nr:DUF3501 family protein [Candidatus Neomarinimicrobiota bacterium]